jgi:hypothetical protein
VGTGLGFSLSSAPERNLLAMKQDEAVIEVMKRNRGYATFTHLYDKVFGMWYGRQRHPSLPLGGLFKTRGTPSRYVLDYGR